MTIPDIDRSTEFYEAVTEPSSKDITELREAYHARSRERRLKELQTGDLYTIGSIERAVVGLGLIPSEQMSAVNTKQLIAQLEQPEIDSISAVTKEEVGRFKRVCEIVRNAEYISPELSSLQIEIHEHAKSAENEYAGRISVSFLVSEMFLVAAKMAGYPEDRIQALFYSNGELSMPTGFQTNTRCTDTRQMIDIPLTQKQLQKVKNNRGEVPHAVIAKQIATRKRKGIIAHGWTGGRNMAHSSNTEIEGDLSRTFFESLQKDELSEALVYSCDALGMGDNYFTDQVDVNHPFGTADYETFLSQLYSLQGMFDGKEADQDLTFIAHSMGAGAVTHLLLEKSKKLLKCSGLKKVSALIFSPAVITERHTKQDTDVSKLPEIQSSHMWADWQVSRPDLVFGQQIMQKIAAQLISGKSLMLKNAFEPIVGEKIYGAISNIITSQLTNRVLLPGDSMPIFKDHIANVGARTEEATLTALGSIADIPISENQIEQLYELLYSDQDKISAVFVTSGNERMVLPLNFGPFQVLVIPGSHYGFKRSDFASHLSELIRLSRRKTAQNIRQILDLIVFRTKTATPPENVYRFLHNESTDYAKVFDLEDTLLLRYTTWRKNAEVSQLSASETVNEFKIAKSVQVDEDANQNLIDLETTIRLTMDKGLTAYQNENDPQQLVFRRSSNE